MQHGNYLYCYSNNISHIAFVYGRCSNQFIPIAISDCDIAFSWFGYSILLITMAIKIDHECNMVTNYIAIAIIPSI